MFKRYKKLESKIAKAFVDIRREFPKDSQRNTHGQIFWDFRRESVGNSQRKTDFLGFRGKSMGNSPWILDRSQFFFFASVENYPQFPDCYAQIDQLESYAKIMKQAAIIYGEPLALDCLGWDSEGLYLLVGDCNSLSNARLLTPHSLLFQVTSSELVEVAGG
ncbi:hypothetical protein DY000_02055645 [Brassica cretica]|uniref:Uncharacterized protein n=1 Tax=Brassica cretica TaxID=69181 RepID=A0ABQ7AKZ0_BRACR|nr:hypothetical protein DY000_02055645 [Brassica cretica]